MLFILLGFLGGWLLYDIQTYRLPAGQWRKIDTLPETTDEILVFSDPGIYIRTTEGNAYACEAVRLNECHVIDEQNIPSELPQACKAESVFAKPDPPGNVIATRDYYCVGIPVEQISFVALADNTIWMWGKQLSEYEFIRTLIYLFGGTVIGFATGALFIWFKK
jgi:hypothetical protein